MKWTQHQNDDHQEPARGRNKHGREIIGWDVGHMYVVKCFHCKWRLHSDEIDNHCCELKVKQQQKELFTCVWDQSSLTVARSVEAQSGGAFQTLLICLFHCVEGDEHVICTIAKWRCVIIIFGSYRRSNWHWKRYSNEYTTAIKVSMFEVQAQHGHNTRNTYSSQVLVQTLRAWQCLWRYAWHAIAIDSRLLLQV